MPAQVVTEVHPFPTEPTPKDTNSFPDEFDFGTQVVQVTAKTGDDDFGDFEDTKPANIEKKEPSVGLFKEPNPPVHDEEDDEGFDDFADAGPVKENDGQGDGAAKSLSHLGGSVLPHETSDFGSLAEVQAGESLFNHEHKVVDLIKENDEFGSFNEGDQEKEQKHEFVFEKEGSSSHKDKEEDDGFGEFVNRDQNQEGAQIREEVETVESVLAGYGLAGEMKREVVEEELAEEIKKRSEEIREEYEKGVFRSETAREGMKKKKFQLSKEMIEELEKELEGMQKYKEAIEISGQVKVRMSE